MKVRLVVVAVGCVVFSSAMRLSADDWPQWRGPNRDAISNETGLLQEWPESGPPLAWQVENIGSGYSTPSIVGDRLYLLTNDGLESEFVQCRSAIDGSPVWSQKIGKVGNPDQKPAYPAARSTPTVDGEHLYALGSDGDLACMKVADGSIVWQKNIQTEFGGKYGEWAYSESPLVDGDAVICTPGGEAATLVGLNKASGEVVWKCAVPGAPEAGYASAIVHEVGGVKQYIQFLQGGLVGVEAGTGKFLWKYERTAEGSPANIPTPVADNGYVYSAAHRSGGGLVKLNVAEGNVTAEQVYFDPERPKAIGGSVKIGENLYGATRQAMMCINFLTGEIKWQDRALGAGSVIYADGRIYYHGENGDLALIEATPEGYREKGRLTPPDQPDFGENKSWSYPAIASGHLFINELGTLRCYDIRSREAAAK